MKDKCSFCALAAINFNEGIGFRLNIFVGLRTDKMSVLRTKKAPLVEQASCLFYGGEKKAPPKNGERFFNCFLN
jgi:hypothetical protein